MSIRTTIILLVVLLLLGGYVFWSGQNADETDETALENTETTPLLPEVALADVQAIAVTSADGETVSLTQQDDTWSIIAPAAAPADTMQVTQVVSELVQLNVTRVITPTEADLAPYGLDAPIYEVEIAGEEGVLAQLYLGATNPNQTSTYVRRDDQEEVIYLVSSFALNSLQEWVTTPPIQPTPLPTPTALPTPATTPTAPPAATATPTADSS
jgi:hypothetical protein